jgi:hypothetical protein
MNFDTLIIKSLYLGSSLVIQYSKGLLFTAAMFQVTALMNLEERSFTEFTSEYSVEESAGVE